MSLAALLASIEGEAKADRPKPLPEATCATLREVAARYAQANPFVAGDLVTPRANSEMKGAGEPNIVLEVRQRPDPDFTTTDPRQTVSNAFGRRADMRVAMETNGYVTQHWVESWMFEPYTGPGSEAAAA